MGGGSRCVGMLKGGWHEGWVSGGMAEGGEGYFREWWTVAVCIMVMACLAHR